MTHTPTAVPPCPLCEGTGYVDFAVGRTIERYPCECKPASPTEQKPAPDYEQPSFSEELEDAEPAPQVRIAAIEKFFLKVRKTNRSSCWEWTGTLNKKGYGMFSSEGCTRAHRFAWLAFRGKIPEGLFVLHRCDNRRCVNPDHLFLGTHQDNMDDMKKKGRQSNRKLLETEILEIRRLAEAGHTKTDISKMFGICRQAISRIVRRERWGHIK